MLLAALAALLGAATQATTGFGFALVLSPVLFAVIEPEEAVTTLLVLSLALNVLVLAERRDRGEVRWRRLTPMLVAALPGLLLGVVILSTLSKQVLQIGVGLAVIGAAAWQLRRRLQERPPALPAGAELAVGFASGVTTTAISISGPPIVLWLEAHRVPPAEFRALLAGSFLFLNLVGGVVLLAAEGGGALRVGLLPPLLAMVLLGHVVGAYAYSRIDHERFFHAALALVLVTGLASVVAGALAL